MSFFYQYMCLCYLNIETYLMTDIFSHLQAKTSTSIQQKKTEKQKNLCLTYVQGIFCQFHEFSYICLNVYNKKIVISFQLEYKKTRFTNFFKTKDVNIHPWLFKYVIHLGLLFLFTTYMKYLSLSLMPLSYLSYFVIIIL